MKNKECIECKQLTAIDQGRNGYEQGLLRAIEIIESISTTVSVYFTTAEAKAASDLKDVLIAKIQAEI